MSQFYPCISQMHNLSPEPVPRTRVHPLVDDHAGKALALLERLDAHSLRTLDALHLAVASAIGAETLATADRIMARAAAELGLQVAMFG